MTVSVIKGDLFDPGHEFDAIGHGVNCRGVMGAGIAAVFKARYPEMYKRYVIMCRYGILRAGGAYVYEPDANPIIFNLASQDEPGPDAREKWYAQSLVAALETPEVTQNWHPDYTVGLPLIGAGIGGLRRESSIGVVEDVAVLYPGVNFTVVEL